MRLEYGSTTSIEPVKAANHSCSAFGCPLFGSLASDFSKTKSNHDGTATTDYARFYCRFHYGQQVSENDGITMRIKQNIEIIENLNLLMLTGDVVQWQLFADRKGFPALQFAETTTYGGEPIHERDYPMKLVQRINLKLKEKICQTKTNSTSLKNALNSLEPAFAPTANTTEP